MNHITLYVLGISCFKCVTKIEKEVEALCGIFSFKGKLPKGKITIEFNPSLVSTNKIIEKIEKQGFAVAKIIQKEERIVMFD
ncbi:copper chaperone [Schinkia azotoformans MEV2011]|uniref:Copper chaperone CopZ n=1 Tax=Schinkia azotoformans MEV2011 TaxID=1348973 RepID=A0A072NI66_SCHAZ|nr:heavy metal-associated domain-containing protein [Schinkia azotoformans]KEF37176.1 copper chaperone [Schinkia azotoformans MEV2011]MEC1695452.1 heavy metal-associated domain-containing protein [Schinkia azotoformans]MEC1725732.1 heavy metal-associated domain-containing protein [Schinkia azotoformans]MEC1781780.1 heavy metal-associated domain-containing protein [Schinkia azotoformans]MED4329131.1 heavy metal-associated domain-containing protein [Schinkia azotoformans]